MKLKDYLKSKLSSIFTVTLVFVFIHFLLEGAGTNSYALFFSEALLLLCFTSLFLREFYQKKQYYDTLNYYLLRLDKKYLLSEMLERPEFMEGEILYDALHVTNKAMNDEIARYQIEFREYQEYVEMWIHEVKTPIASAKLLIENNKNEITRSLEEDLDKIDYYIEQALYYARSSAVSKDYLIKKSDLKEVVNKVIRKNAKLFIREKVQLDLKNLACTIYADEKWLDFILNQLIVNAIKYKKEDAMIQIYMTEENHDITLFISDNGIGISSADLPRIMEKGYTGSSGRKYAKSTGMGLYLCHTLCDKMGLDFSIESEHLKGTTAKIIFRGNSVNEYESD